MIARLLSAWPKIRMKLRAGRFSHVGRRASLGRHVQIAGKGRVSIGERSALRDDCILAGTGVIEIGNRTSINQGCILTAMKQIRIGHDVMLAPRVYVLDVDHKFDSRELPISQQGYDIAPVTIGDGAWIGTGAVITRGVTIGEGAIVGANSVVTRDIPPYAIAAGVPARVIRERP